MAKGPGTITNKAHLRAELGSDHIRLTGIITSQESLPVFALSRSNFGVAALEQLSRPCLSIFL